MNSNMILSHITFQIDVLISTEIFGDRNAIEVLADFAIVDRSDIKEQ